MKEEMLKKVFKEAMEAKKEDKETKKEESKIEMPVLGYTLNPNDLLDDAEDILKDLIKVALDDTKGLVGGPIPLEYLPYVGKVYNLYAKVKESINLAVKHIDQQDMALAMMLGNQEHILRNQEKILNKLADMEKKQVAKDCRKKQAEDE